VRFAQGKAKVLELNLGSKLRVQFGGQLNFDIMASAALLISSSNTFAASWLSFCKGHHKINRNTAPTQPTKPLP